MEQQKITPNPLPNSQSNLHLADITNSNPKTLRSLHNISSQNILSKPKPIPVPQVVISYNFENDTNSQVRTHNLLIGLDSISDSLPKKNTLRKNPILRSNHNSHSNLKNPKKHSQDFRTKLIHVRSNQILSSQQSKPDSTFQSFYSKNDRPKFNQSSTHANTFYNNERKSFEEGKTNHEKYINHNASKIAQRSMNQMKGDQSLASNSIQKISRNNLNRLNHAGQKENQNLKVHSNQVYDLPNPDILERDQSSRLTKRSQNSTQYNHKLEHILRKVKRQATRGNLKEAYVKPQNLQETPRQSHHSKSKLSPQSRSIHQSSFDSRNPAHQNQKHSSQHQGQSEDSKPIDQHFASFDPLKMSNVLNRVDPGSEQILKHQKSLIEKQNNQKPKRKYHQLLKNPSNKKNDSLAQEFHRIESENENQVGSSKVVSKLQIPDKNLPDKNIDYSINGHLNQNPSKIKEAQPDLPAQQKQGIVLQKLQFNKNPKKDTNAHHASPQQKSVQPRYNNHAPTIYQRNNANQKSDRKRLNSSIDPNPNSPCQQREEGHTKRKIPADYKDFLRFLSQENQKKKQIEELERQRELSLNAQKTSRFQNLELQNQHIKRILTPIGNSFMDERRKRLSDQRKSKKKERKELKNLDGSIIESNSESSDEDRKKSYSKRRAKKLKNRKAHSKAVSNIEPSISKPNNFRQSLLSSVQKIKKQSGLNSPNVSRLGNFNSRIQESSSKAIINSASFSNHEEESVQQESLENVEKEHKNPKDKIQKFTGDKIPEKAIQRAKLKKNLRKNIHETTRNHQKDVNLQNENSISDAKIISKNDKAARNTQQSSSKNPISTKKEKTESNQQRFSKQNNQQNVQNQKKDKTSKIKPVDKRTVQQKQRKQKNWNQAGKSQKSKQQQGLHTKKDKKVNQKDWKEGGKAQKDKKDKQKLEEYSDSSDEDQQKSGLIKDSKKQKKNKAKGVNQTLDNKEVDGFDSQNNDSKSENGEEQNGKEQKQNTQSGKNQEDQSQNGDSQNVHQNDKRECKGSAVRNPKTEKQKHFKEETSNTKEVKDSNQNIQTKQCLPSIHKNVEKLEGKTPVSMKEGQPKNPNIKSSQTEQMQSVDSKILSQELPHSGSQNKKLRISTVQSKDLNSPDAQNKQLRNPGAQNKNFRNSGVKNKEIRNPGALNIENQKTNEQNDAHIKQPSKSTDSPNPKQQVQSIGKSQPKKSSSESNNTETLSRQIEEEKKQQVIQNVIENQQMQQNGFMEITHSKFDIYNHDSQKSSVQNSIHQIPSIETQELEKRAQIVKFLYSLPLQYQQEITKFIPNQAQERILTPKLFTNLNAKTFISIKIPSLKTVLEQLSVFDTLNPKFTENKTNVKDQQTPKHNFLNSIFEPYRNLNHQVGIWFYCVGVWRLITVHYNSSKSDQNTLLSCLEKAFEAALKKYYSNIRIEEIRHEEILRMLTGLRISNLAKTKGKADKIFRQIEYNTRKHHIIRAISSSESKFSKDAINCVRKIEITPNGQRVLQILSVIMGQRESKPKYFWIREDKFLQFFTSFTIMSRRRCDSYWTNDHIKIKNQDKAVYMLDSSQKHTSGSITLYPMESEWGLNKPKCTIAFYKEIEPQVLKLVGKAMERLPQSKDSVHTSKLYFEFNVKGTYFVFLELENGLYNVSIESNSPQTRLEFVEFVKKETNRNEQCEYVEIDKIFKKKPNINTFQNSSEFKQLMNFMKKTSPQVYQAK